MKTKKKKTNKSIVKFQKKLRRHLKLAIVPHKSNQYRPHLVRRYGLLVVLILVVGVQLGYNVSLTGRVLGAQPQVAIGDLLNSTNEQRTKYSREPLRISDQLSKAALLKGQDMLSKQYWAHQAPDGTTPWHWFNQVNYGYTYAGENLAKNFMTAQAATTAWMASPGHRANLLDENYTEAGFAVVEGSIKGRTVSIIVALYGHPTEKVGTPAVASVQRTGSTLATDPSGYPLSILTRLGMAVQSISPATIGAMMLILAATSVAFVAHFYRNKLPKSLRQSWYRHHGLIKTAGTLTLCFVILILYSGGQI